jgi:ParB family chromosome partitioning protein
MPVLDKKTQARGRMAEAASKGRGKPASPKVKEAPPLRVVPDPMLESTTLPLDKIVGGDNPRTEVDEKAQRELVDSIKEHGVLQAIRVRPVGDGTYAVVMGFRRLAAARAAKLKEIPVTVGVATDTDAFVEALVENIVRQDLNPLDEARAFLKLQEQGLSQEAIGKRIGHTQSYVSNSLRLLNTAPEVQEALHSGKLSTAHARAMVTLPEEAQRELAQKVVTQNMTSKSVEAAVAETKDRVRQDERRANEAALFLKKHVEAIAAHREQDKTFTDSTIVVVRWNVRDELKALVPNPLVASNEVEVHEHREGFTCDCTAQSYEPWDQSWKIVCIKPEHWKAFRKEADRDRQKRAQEAGKKVNRLRKEVADLLLAGESELSGDALRLMVYMANRNDYQRAPRLIKAWGGESSESYSVDNAELWRVIAARPLADVVQKLVDELVPLVVPNVFGDPWNTDRDVEIRRWFVKERQVSDELVWGGRTDEQVEELRKGRYSGYRPTELSDAEVGLVDDEDDEGEAEDDAEQA